MKKILHIITGLDTGGAEMMLYKLLSVMNGEKKYDSAVISLGGRGTIGPLIESLGIPLYPFNLTSTGQLLAAFSRLRRIIWTEQPDLVQGWMYHGNFAGLLIKFFIKTGVPLLWNIRYSLYDLSREKPGTRRIIKLGGLFSRIPRATIYNSKIATGQHRQAGFTLARYKVIPNGFDCQVLHPSPEARTRVRSELKLSEDNFIVGHVARFHPMKDHAGLFKAMHLLYEKYPEVHYLLSGRGVDNTNQTFQRFLGDFPDPKRIRLLGERSDIPALTASFDLAVSSSSWGEGFSNTIGEAMACGVPCVVTEVGDSAWIVGDGGLVVPPSKPAELAEAMERIILMSRLERREMGNKGRRRIEGKFSIREVTRQYTSLYDDILTFGSLRD